MKQLLVSKKINMVAVLVIGALIILSSCHTKHHREPDHVYMPDMYYSRAYNSYTENPNFANDQTSRLPVPGTIKRGAMLPYHIPGTDSGYAYSGLVKSPITVNDSVLNEGKRLFNIYCAICHGEKLDGDGPLYNGGSGPFPAAPANFIAGPKTTLPEGTMFWVATYGKNLMGSYASQVNEYQRWMIVSYIKSVQRQKGTTQAQDDSTQQTLVTAYQEMVK